jgi:heme A synthase
MKLNSFAKYTWIVLTANMFVILWGAFVRASGSGAGCGSHWPLCNGEVVPLAPQVQTIVEFTHRITSGTAFLMVVAMVVWAWRIYPAGDRVRSGAVASLAGMIVESLAGAGLVLFHWTAFDISFGRVIIMPVHLIITFSLLIALVLTAWWASGGKPVRLQGQGKFTWMLGSAMLATLLMGMAGAVTALGDTVLPASSLTPGSYSTLSAAGQLLVDMRAWHPLIAVAVGVYLLIVAFTVRDSRPSPMTNKLTLTLVVLFGIEMGAGVLNIYLAVPIWMQLTHLLLANLAWITLILLSAVTLAAEHDDESRPNVVK